VIDRFAQIEPSVLIAVPGYHYNGKEYRRDDVVRQIAAALPGLAAVVLTTPLDGSADGFGDVPVLDWDQFGIADAGDEPPSEPEYTDVPFGHPLWVLYSSGTSEFYRVVEAFPEVADSLVVDTGQLGTDGRLVLYVTLAQGADLDADLTGRLRGSLREKLSPRHVPDAIHQVPGIPRTLSGKKLEVPVRKILLGTPIAQAVDPDALANPDVLVHFAPDDAAASTRRPG